MFEYKIIWSPKAEISLLDTLEFIIETHQSNSYAIKIVDEIERVEKLLSKTPYIGHTIELSLNQTIYKFVIMNNYSLIYRIIEYQSIEIIYFWDNRQNPKKLNSIIKN